MRTCSDDVALENAASFEDAVDNAAVSAVEDAVGDAVVKDGCIDEAPEGSCARRFPRHRIFLL